MFKYIFSISLIVFALLLWIQIFNSQQGLILEINNLISEEDESNYVYLDQQGPFDMFINFFTSNKSVLPDSGYSVLNDIYSGIYIMGFDNDKKELDLMINNRVRFIYSLPESNRKFFEMGYWRSLNNGDIEMVITNNQFGKYKKNRNFLFAVKDNGGKLVSKSYDNPLYGSAGFVFYKKQ